jgi:hypothetical protein
MIWATFESYRLAARAHRAILTGMTGEDVTRTALDVYIFASMSGEVYEPGVGEVPFYANGVYGVEAGGNLTPEPPGDFAENKKEIVRYASGKRFCGTMSISFRIHVIPALVAHFEVAFDEEGRVCRKTWN